MNVPLQYQEINAVTSDPSLAQVKLLLDFNHDKYSGNFDTTVEYPMNQISHQQINQYYNIASWQQCPQDLETGLNILDLEMPLIHYKPEECAQLSSAQKSSIRKCHVQ